MEELVNKALSETGMKSSKLRAKIEQEASSSMNLYDEACSNLKQASGESISLNCSRKKV